MDLYDQLIRDEGLRLKPYKDTVGKLTIGIGRNLSDVGISRDEAMEMMRNDCAKVEEGLTKALPWFATLNDVRRAALMNMGYNMGVETLLGFHVTLELMASGSWNAAAEEMLKSLWAKQVGERAKRLAQQFRTGEWV